MSDLVVIGYPDEKTADNVRSRAIGSTSLRLRAWVVRSTSGTHAPHPAVPVNFRAVGLQLSHRPLPSHA